MSRVTKFAARDPGPAARMAGFMAHLRMHGLRVGVGEAETALRALTHIQASNPEEARRALKSVCSGCGEEVERFDDLFDSFWLNGGRVRQKVMSVQTSPNTDDVHSSRPAKTVQTGSGTGSATTPDGGDGEAAADGEGKLVACSVQNLMKKDLRDLVQPEDIAEAEAIARRLGAALRDRRSRRRKAARKGDQIHFRKLIRQSLSTGGEPFCLPRKQRPGRPQKIVAICDVSGSMALYAQVFLAFLSGLMRADDATDAYLFHTRLVRITDALRDKDALRALGRMSVLADGFGGGSNIGASLSQFSKTYARRFVDGRSVVMILSDGYDTGPAHRIGDALAALKKRGCKIIWLNPLKGWNGYEPVAKGMAAALPHLDLFRAANRLADLAALEPELSRL
ncbi:vWA domain-containing protein [Parasedimentitalea huanghaiensis]|uniref:VWA domain-containing protein n=1 Tax=Parasedimentitalea huanghaiensis TaxID=2682100 RepID=A0A6L6WL70_9RHOB|nr:VWA domain-containing protein [Zongyanglinia huanghaiensis]MVO17355.1 VWA domain-containing protein [Zongyanglinia huanghaiensis]